MTGTNFPPSSPGNPAVSFDIQSGLYGKMKQALKGTKIYQDLGLEQINTYEEYVREVPARDHEFYESYVKELETVPNLLFTDELKYYGVSSGTSGEICKKIPYNSAMVGIFLSFQRDIGCIVAARTAGVNPATSMQFTYGSHYVSREAGKIPRGYISGLIAAFAAKNFRPDLLFPSIAALRIPGWAEKMAAIAEEVKDKDIRVMSGVPSYLINILEEINRRLKINNLREIWPNLEACCYSGTSIQNYRERLDELAGLPLKYTGVYLSTEAPLGLTRTASGDYSFNTGLVLYSFNLFSDPDGKTLGIHELAPGGEYLVNIGTPNGFIKYALNDVIRVTRTEPCIEFQVIGRKGPDINIATEKVPLIVTNSAIAETGKKLRIAIRHYFLYPSQNKNIPCYEWLLICDNAGNIPTETISGALDRELMALAPKYKDRRDSATIGAPIVKILPAGLEKVCFEKYNQKGQMKLKSIFDGKSSFIDFIRQIDPEAAAKLD